MNINLYESKADCKKHVDALNKAVLSYNSKAKLDKVTQVQIVNVDKLTKNLSVIYIGIGGTHPYPSPVRNGLKGYLLNLGI